MSKPIEDFELLYSPSRWSKRFDASTVLEKHIDFLEKQSKLVKETVPCELNVSYGPGKREKFDVYGTDLGAGSPTLIHIHGGYYQEKDLTHSNNGFLANSFHRRGIRTILLGYELAPERTVGEILEHLQIGLRECIKYAKQAQTGKIFLSGHSAGAHAIAAILSDFQRSIPQEDRDLIVGAFLLGGLYDLTPVTKMSANDLLNLTEEIARIEYSPIFEERLEFGDTKVYVIAAEYDSPAFVDQSKRFFAKLREDGVKSELKIVPKVDHFDIVERLFDEEFELSKFIADAITKK